MAVEAARRPLTEPPAWKLGRWLAYLQGFQAALAAIAILLDWPADWIDANARWLGLVAPWYVFGVYWDAGWPLVGRLAAVVGAFVTVPVGLWISSARASRTSTSARLVAIVTSAGLAIGIQAFAFYIVYGL